MSDLEDRRGGPDDVYPPAEDSALLVRATKPLLAPEDRVFEVGVGSGWVAEQLLATGACVVGGDINPAACRACADRGVPVIRSNLLDAVRTSSVDVVCFNPPYLPADDRTDATDWMGRAITGGADGRAVIRPFLADLRRVLVADGVGVLIVSTLTDLDAVREIASRNNLDTTVAIEEAHPFERLIALECRLK